MIRALRSVVGGVVRARSPIGRRLRCPAARQVHERNYRDDNGRTAVHGEHPREMRAAPVASIARGPRVIDDKDLRDTPDDEIESCKSAEHSSKDSQEAPPPPRGDGYRSSL